MAAAPKAVQGRVGLDWGERLNPGISFPYIVRQPDHKVRADCLSGAGLGVAHAASIRWAESKMEGARGGGGRTFSCVNAAA